MINPIYVIVGDDAHVVRVYNTTDEWQARVVAFLLEFHGTTDLTAIHPEERPTAAAIEEYTRVIEPYDATAPAAPIVI